jgi:hypothetical protein
MTVAGKAPRRATVISPRRLAESAAEATLILALVLAPTGWRALDAQLTVVLTVMLVLLTAVAYALHAVTFDYFRLTDRPTEADVPVDGTERLNRTGAAGRMRG